VVLGQVKMTKSCNMLAQNSEVKLFSKNKLIFRYFEPSAKKCSSLLAKGFLSQISNFTLISKCDLTLVKSTPKGLKPINCLAILFQVKKC
jgi:hypothetical protein